MNQYSQTQFPKSGYFWVFLFIGIGLGCTQLFAPLHEAAHVTVALNNGVTRASITGWASSEMSTLDRPAILSGWIVEVIVLSFLAFMAALINSPKCRWVTGGMWYGAAIVHWARSFGSSDFTDTLYRSFSNQGAAQYYPQYRNGLVMGWSFMGIVIFLFVGLVIMAGMKKAPASTGAVSSRG
jgi:hypothetical protein